MRYLFLLLLCCSGSQLLTAQDATVEETETAGRYFFRVHLENGKSKELMRCVNEVTTKNINVKVRGELTFNVAPETTLTLVTRDRTLWIEHDGRDPATRRQAKELVVATEQCLDIPLTTTSSL